MKTIEELENDLFHRLLLFAVDMDAYQEVYNSRCQCGDCTFGKPTPGQAIQAKLSKHVSGLDLRQVREYYSQCCDLGLALRWVREDQKEED